MVRLTYFMIWIIYNLLFPVVFVLALPYYLLRMVRRGGYWKGFVQRLGVYDSGLRAALAARKRVWVHAVSVGETFVALRFMEEWRRANPGVAFVLTVNTSTGRALAAKALHPDDVMVYFPVDTPLVLWRVFRTLRPVLLVLTECEFWPNLIGMAARRGIPMMLINGRLSDRSFRGYRRFRWLFRPVLRLIDRLCVQSLQDRDRFLSLGVEGVTIKVTGSAKYDVALQTPGRVEDGMAILAEAGISPGVRILVGGSTWAGEEDILLDVFGRLRGEYSDLRLVLVPRHAERRDEVVEAIRRRGLAFVQRSRGGAVEGGGTAEVLLADTTGELRHLYTVATVIFVGKSLTQHGGQNPIEPAACAKPVLVGPNMENFADVMREFLAAEGVVQVADALELEGRLRDLLNDEGERRRLGERASGVVQRNRGSLVAMVEGAEALLSAGRR